jgi:hypothetical protein
VRCYEVTNEMRSKFRVGFNGNRLDMSEIVCSKRNTYFFLTDAQVVERIISLIA